MRKFFENPLIIFTVAFAVLAVAVGLSSLGARRLAKTVGETASIVDSVRDLQRNQADLRDSLAIIFSARDSASSALIDFVINYVASHERANDAEFNAKLRALEEKDRRARDDQARALRYLIERER